MGIPGRRQHAKALLSRAEHVKLRALIERIEQETSAEICLVILHDTEDPRKFALDYFNHHGIGKKDLNNGVLILVVLAKRRIELVVGDGLRAAIPQKVFDGVIADVLAPHFRQGQFGKGLHLAIETLERSLHETLPPTHVHPRGQVPPVVDLESEKPS